MPISNIKKNNKKRDKTYNNFSIAKYWYKLVVKIKAKKYY